MKKRFFLLAYYPQSGIVSYELHGRSAPERLHAMPWLVTLRKWRVGANSGLFFFGRYLKGSHARSFESCNHSAGTAAWRWCAWNWGQRLLWSRRCFILVAHEQTFSHLTKCGRRSASRPEVTFRFSVGPIYLHLLQLTRRGSTEYWQLWWEPFSPNPADTVTVAVQSNVDQRFTLYKTFCVVYIPTSPTL